MTFKFGVASDINADVATVAFIVTVAFLVLLEHTTKFAEKSLGASPTYNKMLQKIYMELMSTGFVSFALAMYQAMHPASQNKSWLQVFDFIGYMLFFVAIFFVAHGLYIIMISLLSARKYSQYHSTPIAAIVQDINSLNSELADAMYHCRLLPFSTLRTIAEFKIIHAIFRDTYWLPMDFDYGLYLSGCFERYSLKIISISDSSWALAVFLCLLNYMRLKLGPQWMWNCRGFKHADDPEADNAGRYGMSTRCTLLHLQLFFCCGCALSVYIVAVYLVSKLYIIRLLHRAGVVDVEEYLDFLRLEQSTSQQPENCRRVEIEVGKKGRETMRMSIATLRTNLDAVNRELVEQDHNNKRMTHFPRWSRMSSILHKINPFTEPYSNKVKPARSTLHTQQSSSRGAKRRKAVLRTEEDKFGVITRRSSVTLELRGGARGDLCAADTVAEEGGTAHRIRSISAVDKFLKMKQRRVTTRRESWILGALQNLMSGGVRPEGDVNMKISEDFSSVYLFNNPALYFKIVEFGVMLNSLYLSLWMTNFIAVVNTETRLHVLWQILMMCPLVIIIPVIGEVVKVASQLSAIAELNLDVMGIVLEEMEEQKQLLQQLRCFVRNRIRTTDAEEAKEVIETLFDSIDLDGSGNLSVSEVRDFLRALHLHYSDAKYSRVYKALDANGDGYVSCDELFASLFPQFCVTQERAASGSMCAPGDDVPVVFHKHMEENPVVTRPCYGDVEVRVVEPASEEFDTSDGARGECKLDELIRENDRSIAESPSRKSK